MWWLQIGVADLLKALPVHLMACLLARQPLPAGAAHMLSAVLVLVTQTLQLHLLYMRVWRGEGGGRAGVMEQHQYHVSQCQSDICILFVMS